MACSGGLVRGVKFRLIESFQGHRHTDNRAAALRYPQIPTRYPKIPKGCQRGKMRLAGRGVGCVRGGREVFSGVDFEVSLCEALAVTGPNGSGKTSLLRLIAGLLTMADGSIGLEGGEGELTLPEQAHYLGHRDALKPALSVLENLCFWQKFLGGEVFDAGQAIESLTAVGIDHAAQLPAAFLSA